MKRQMILRVSVIALLAVFSLSVYSQGIIVYKKDGTKVVHSYTEVDSIVTYSEGIAVDLGLPSGTLWADRNIGADSPEGYGDYFAWGELDPKSNYATFNSITHDKRFKEIAGNSHYDAVTAKLGNSFHTPTLADFEELIKNCVWAQSSINGVNGFLVTGSNGNSIFLPASGYRDGTSYNNDGKLGEYWTSTPHKDPEYSYYLFFSGDSYSTFWNSRYAGRCIRPVKK